MSEIIPSNSRHLIPGYHGERPLGQAARTGYLELYRCRSDIRLADAEHYPVTDVGPHSGGRNRPANPKGMAPFGTIVRRMP